MPQPKLPPSKRAEIVSLFEQGMSRTAIHRVTGVSLGCVSGVVRDYEADKHGDTVRKLATKKPRRVDVDDLPAGVHEEDGLPDPVESTYDRYTIDTPGHWLILSDVHIPYHDRATIRTAVDEARKRNVVGVILNGDILDCAAISRHAKHGDEPDIEDEFEKGRALLSWLRGQFPAARIVYKEGNHEERMPAYLVARAPELFGIKALQLPNLLGMTDYGVEWVDDKRIIDLGKLPVCHGHEFRGGGGVNPARWLFLRSVSTAICGHFHRTSQHDEMGLDGRLHGVWSVGCACYLYPRYDRTNKWNHGYALVEVSAGGSFRVTNRKILRDGSFA